MSALLLALAIPCAWLVGHVIWDCFKPLPRSRRPASSSNRQG